MSADLHESQVLDGYRLIRFLGRGGFGEVWLCQSVSMGDYRALKFIPTSRADLFDKEYEALVHYRNAAAQLRSPQLVSIEHVNRNDAGLYYIMPLADGCEELDPSNPRWEPLCLGRILLERRSSGTWFTSRQVVDLIQPILIALQTLSDAGLVHRDVKPENILIFDGKPCLADISLLGADALVVTRRGTPGYATPTWYKGGHPDMYGAAATLYTLLSGNPPDMMGRQAFIWPPQGEASLSEVERAEWRRLHAIIRRATDEKISERFVDFATMASALDGLDSLATTTTHRTPLSRQKRKVPAQIAVVLLFVFAVVGIFTAVRGLRKPPETLVIQLGKNASQPSPVVTQPSDSSAESPVVINEAESGNSKQSRPPLTVDPDWKFSPIRERVIEIIPAVVASKVQTNQLSLEDYAEVVAIEKLYKTRDYAHCLEVLDSRIKNQSANESVALQMLLKALILKHLNRQDEMKSTVSQVVDPPGEKNPKTGWEMSLVNQRLTLLEALGLYDLAEAYATKSINEVTAVPVVTANSEVSDLYQKRARFRILKGNYAGALADERALMALPREHFEVENGTSEEKLQQGNYNTIVSDWDFLELEFPEYGKYLEANGWPQPAPDERELVEND